MQGFGMQPFADPDRLLGFTDTPKGFGDPVLDIVVAGPVCVPAEGGWVELAGEFVQAGVVVRLVGSEVKVKCLNAVCTEHYLAFFVPQISQGVWDVVISSAQGRTRIKRVVYAFGDCGHDFGRILRGFFPPSAFRT